LVVINAPLVKFDDNFEESLQQNVDTTDTDNKA